MVGKLIPNDWVEPAANVTEKRVAVPVFTEVVTAQVGLVEADMHNPIKVVMRANLSNILNIIKHT